jgi:plasmid stability protein
VPTITLKDIPRNLHRALKSRARTNRRSLNQEVIATLEAATTPVGTKSTALQLDEPQQARSQFKRAVTLSEITSWIFPTVAVSIDGFLAA